MKRKLTLLAVLFLLFSFVGCKTDAPSNGPLPEDINDEIPDEIYGQETEIVIGPKDAYNPLTGEYNLARERSGQRPLAININNIHQSWPQSGIADADILFEMETEGGITRMMAVFSDIRELEKIGTVRSQRDHLMEAVAFLDPVFIHWGTTAPVDYVIQKYDLQQLDVCLPPLTEFFSFRDEGRLKRYSSENTFFIDGTKIGRAMETLGVPSETTKRDPAFHFFAETA